MTAIQWGFLVVANGGTGCIIICNADDGLTWWTGPSSIAVGGLSKMDYILMLPNENAFPFLRWLMVWLSNCDFQNRKILGVVGL